MTLEELKNNNLEKYQEFEKLLKNIVKESENTIGENKNFITKLLFENKDKDKKYIMDRERILYNIFIFDLLHTLECDQKYTNLEYIPTTGPSVVSSNYEDYLEKSKEENKNKTIRNYIRYRKNGVFLDNIKKSEKIIINENQIPNITREQKDILEHTVKITRDKSIPHIASSLHKSFVQNEKLEYNKIVKLEELSNETIINIVKSI
jgi:hypothetical protein